MGFSPVAWLWAGLLVAVVVVSCVDSTSDLTYDDVIQRPLLFAKAYKEHQSYVKEVTEDIRKIVSALSYEALPALFGDKGFQDGSATVLDWDSILSELKESNVSQLCLNHTNLVLDGLLNAANNTWALQMVDAAGKPGPYLLQAWWNWIGSYTECLNVTVTPDLPDLPVTAHLREVTPPQQPFLPKYCTARLPLLPSPDMSHAPIPIPSLTMLAMGVCVPDSCTASDIDVILTSLLSRLLDLVKKTGALNANFTLTFEGTTCQERTHDFSTAAYASIVVMSLILTLLCVGTLYDVIAVQWLERQPREDAVVDALQDAKTSIQSHETTPLLAARQQDLVVTEMQRGVCGRLLLAFSVHRNGSKLLATHAQSGSLDCVHGVRFLSMTWVILGHVYAFGITASQNFTTASPVFLQRWTFMAVVGGFFAVDSFFTLSGVLVAYLALRELQRNEGKLNWLKFYLHRYWRLTPPYMLLMLLYVPLMPYLLDAPLWPQEGFEKNQCRDTWWTNLLYINNLVRSEDMCMVWSWYLANDMQFYILSPLIFVPLYYSKVGGMIASAVFLLVTFISTGLISAQYQLPASMVTLNQRQNSSAITEFSNYYYKPYCRMGPYVVGMLAGYLLFKTEGRLRLPKWASLSGWALATGSGLAVVYGVFPEVKGELNSVAVDALYNAVSRSVWGACVAWVLVACVTGHGGWVNTLLSWKALVPLSRLTYCAYLVHPIVCFVFFVGQDTLYVFSDVSVIFTFPGVLVISYAAAFLLSLAFEAPMLALERELLKKLKRS